MAMNHFVSVVLRVIPAQTGVQTGHSDVRELRLDPRLRGDDVVGGGEI